MGVRSTGDLHRDVLHGDSAAFEDLVALILQTVPSTLARRFPRASRDSIVDAVEDALLDYSANPEAFDHKRGLTLETFLTFIASRNLINTSRSEARRRVRETAYAEELARRKASDRIPAAHHRITDTLLSSVSSDADREFLLAWMCGFELSGECLTALGLHQPGVNQRLALKTVRERIVRRLKRKFDRLS
jgi:hypothetical protein